MDSEVKIIIAFLFNRSGKTELKDSDLYLALSMELGWLSTKESQEFVKYAIKQELLVKQDGLLHPNFPFEKINIPLGFTPTKKQFTEKAEQQKVENIVDGIITQISIQTLLPPDEILKKITQEENEKNLLPEIAALYVARKYKVEITKWFDIVEKILGKENKGG